MSGVLTRIAEELAETLSAADRERLREDLSSSAAARELRARCTRLSGQGAASGCSLDDEELAAVIDRLEDTGDAGGVADGVLAEALKCVAPLPAGDLPVAEHEAARLAMREAAERLKTTPVLRGRKQTGRNTAVWLTAAAAGVAVAAVAWHAVRPAVEDRPPREERGAVAERDGTLRGPDSPPIARPVGESDGPPVLPDDRHMAPLLAEATVEDRPLTPEHADAGDSTAVESGGVDDPTPATTVRVSRVVGLPVTAGPRGTYRVLDRDAAVGLPAEIVVPYGSWLSLDVGEGRSVVVPAGGRVRLAFAAADAVLTAEPDEESAVAFRGFREGDTVEIAGRTRLTLTEPSEFAVVSTEGGAPTLRVWRGKLRLTVDSGETVSVGGGRQWRSGDGVAAFDRSADGWRNGPAGPRLSDRLTARLRKEPDVITALFRVDGELAGEAALVLLDLTNGRAASRLVVSKDPRHRDALRGWLRDVPAGRFERVWPSLRQTGQATALTQRWFEGMRSGATPDERVIASLLGRLGADAPLFERETAIALLRGVTGRRLPEYDASAPTRSAVEAVRRRVDSRQRGGRP